MIPDNFPLSPPGRAIILAAGRGKRLRPYTDHKPKPLLRVNSRPMLETVLISLKETDVNEVCIVVNHLAEQIKSFAGDGGRWDLKISYVFQEKPLGTADAVRCAADFITETCYILAADYALPRYFLSEFQKAYVAQSCPLFVSLKELDTAELTQKSSVRFDKNGKITEIVEKPQIGKVPSSIGASLFLIVPVEIRRYLRELTFSARGEFELTHVLNRMIQDGYAMNGLLQRQPPEWIM